MSIKYVIESLPVLDLHKDDFEVGTKSRDNKLSFRYH